MLGHQSYLGVRLLARTATLFLQLTRLTQIKTEVQSFFENKRNVTFYAMQCNVASSFSILDNRSMQVNLRSVVNGNL